MDSKFIIVDGSSLIHRAFYALPTLTTSSGQYTNAVFGFTNMIVKLLADWQPAGMVVAFDKGKKTFRNEEYADYKAQRKPTPTELSEQFPMAREVLEAMGITVLEVEGFEADDIIGTLAAQASPRQEFLIVTGDRAHDAAFHRAGLANGGRDNGAPGLRPHYHANYFGAFLYDPFGNRVEAVCHRAE